MEKHYPSYFKSTPPPYKLTLLFLPKKFILPPIKSHLKIFIPPLLRVGGEGAGSGRVQTMDLDIETNIHLSILFLLLLPF